MAFSAVVSAGIAYVALNVADEATVTAKRANVTAERSLFLETSPLINLHYDQNKGELGLRNFGSGVAVPYFVRLRIGGHEAKFTTVKGVPYDYQTGIKQIWAGVEEFMTPELRTPYAASLGSRNPLAFIMPQETNDYFSLAEISESLDPTDLPPMSEAQKEDIIRAFRKAVPMMQIDVCYTDVFGIQTGVATSLASPKHMEKECPTPPAAISLADIMAKANSVVPQ